MKNLIDYSGNFDPFLSDFFVINKHLRAFSLENALIVVIAWHSIPETFIKLTSSGSFGSAKMAHFKILPRNLFGNPVFISIFYNKLILFIPRYILEREKKPDYLIAATNSWLIFMFDVIKLDAYV